MGAWGPGSFENDDAMDWVAELLEARDFSLLRDAFEMVLEEGGGYLEAPDCSTALAAAEVVAALNARGADDLPDEVKLWVSERLGRLPSGVNEQARRAVGAVLETSELKDLWDDSDAGSAWRGGVENLLRRLA